MLELLHNDAGLVFIACVFTTFGYILRARMHEAEQATQPETYEHWRGER